MAEPIPLQPYVRERLEPRMSATSLAEYLLAEPHEQDDILHDSRFARPPIVSAYQPALDVLTAYNCDPLRGLGSLANAKQALATRSEAANLRPKERERARGNLEAIECFERAENAFGLRGARLVKPPRYPPLAIHGVSLSVQPDFQIERAREKELSVGAGFLRLAKSPDPNSCKRPGTRLARSDARREMARYILAMLGLLVDRYPPLNGTFDRKLCFVADVRLGERIDPAGDHPTRVKAVTSACDHITRLWPSITPKPSLLLR